MRFRLLADDEVLGCSELEGADPSMGVRIGKFVPHENYSKYRDLFRRHSKSRAGVDIASEPTAEYEKLQVQIESLHLRVEADSGESVGSMHIDLEDFSGELGEDSCELSIVVDGRSTYEKFFE